MFKTSSPYTKKQPNNISIINKNDIINNDLTGSLLTISVPIKLISNSKTKKKEKINIFTRNANGTIIDNTWIALGGGVVNVTEKFTEPIKSTSQRNPNKKKINMSIINTKVIKDNFRKEILEYGSKYIRKSISSFDSGSNQLIIENTSLDYGTESVSPDNFEILYNGVHIPGIYTVDIVGNDVVITLQQDYIDYDNLTPQSTEINIYGKFK